MMNKSFFITGTDTGIGKTIATCVLGILLQDRGFDVGVMKPIQCGGKDAAFLRKSLDLEDPLSLINPYFAPEPLSPHLAFPRARKTIAIDKILKGFHALQDRHEIVLVEGAGGLLVPITPDYFVQDLVKDLGLELIIVSRLGLGTINHTLLTIQQARHSGLDVGGVIFSAASPAPSGIPEKTNPQAIKTLSGVRVLGTIPYLPKIEKETILKCCSPRVNLKELLERDEERGAGRRPPRHDSRRGAGALKDWDKEYLWHPFTQMKDWLKAEPLIIEEGQGCYLKDTEGRWYLDGVSSLWVNVHGHKKFQIDEALKTQINRLGHSTLLGLSNVPAVQLAKRLVEIAPRGLTKVFYSDNGSTAVEVAVKMAYQYWQNIGRTKRRHLVHLANSYHGDTLGAVSVGDIDLFHQVYRDLVIPTIPVEFPDFYRCPSGKSYPGYTLECLKKLEMLFQRRHDSIAAFIIEPLVQAAAGMIVWPKGLLKRISRLCRKYDVLLIADEVATGMGRTGKMFACEHEGVTPDLLCLAKGLTGGYLPLAATLTTRRIFEGFLFDYKDQKTFFHGHTYTGNPLACAAAMANLEVFEKERTLQKLTAKIKHLSKGLKRFYNLPSVGDLRQKGFMVGIELVRDRRTKEPYAWEEKIGVRVCQEARKRGVILRPLGNVIVLMPPLAISLKEIDQLLEAMYGAIRHVMREQER